MSMLLPSTLLAVLVAALAVAGCGGQKVAADEVPGAPVALQVPEVSKGGSDALAGNSSSTSVVVVVDQQSSQDSGDAAATATATPTASGQSGTSGTTQSGSTGGTRAPRSRPSRHRHERPVAGQRQHVRRLLQEQPRRLLSAERGSLRDPPAAGPGTAAG